MSEDAHTTVDETVPEHAVWSRLDSDSDARYVVTVDLAKLTSSEKFKFLEMWRKVRVIVDRRA